MAPTPRTSISEHVAPLTDPRAEQGQEHLPIDILTITRCRAIGAPDSLAVSAPDHAWPTLRRVGWIASPRRIGDAVSTDARHDLSSLPADAARLQHVIRSRWGVENRLHGVLDLAFHEGEECSTGPSGVCSPCPTAMSGGSRAWPRPRTRCTRASPST